MRPTYIVKERSPNDTRWSGFNPADQPNCPARDQRRGKKPSGKETKHHGWKYLQYPEAAKELEVERELRWQVKNDQ